MKFLLHDFLFNLKIRNEENKNQQAIHGKFKTKKKKAEKIKIDKFCLFIYLFIYKWAKKI